MKVILIFLWKQSDYQTFFSTVFEKNCLILQINSLASIFYFFKTFQVFGWDFYQLIVILNLKLTLKDMELAIKGTFFFDLIQIIELVKSSHYVISTQDDIFKILQVWKKFMIVFYFFSIKMSFYRSKPHNSHKIGRAKLR